MAMEMFHNAKVVRLRSHLNKYLVADEDGQQTRQSRTGGESKNARWRVEAVEGNSSAVRLKSCHGGRYLTASDEPLFLGVTGNKVTLSLPENIKDLRIEWHPFKDGFQIKLRAYGGTFLRANGGVPPWRNSITHDNVLPNTTSTNNWILWNVDAVDEVPENGTTTDCLSAASSFSSISSQLSGLNFSSPSSAPSTSSPGISKTPSITLPTNPAMEIFHMAKKVRLVSHHKKYLMADEDEESVIQGRRGASDNARWTVEYPENTNNLVRLKSYYGKYLTASNHSFLLGMTGRKVLQTLPDPLNSTLEWEPIMEGKLVKLKTRSGRFLRANGGLPPWRNSVTHDTSTHKMAVEEWLLWDVHVLEIVVS